MNAFRSIRERLKVSQAEIGAALDVSQSNVSFYEKGQTVPPAVAAKLIEFARSRGLNITYDHVYGSEALSAPPAQRAPTEAPAAHDPYASLERLIEDRERRQPKKASDKPR
jgi:putative transcriptional regulator